MALCQTTKEAIWLTGLLGDLGTSLHSPLIILADSQGAISLAQNPVFHPRSKHIAIQFHFTREQVKRQRIALKYISTKSMIADALTKSLPHPQHATLTQAMGIF
jgi:hypothetical protein